MFDFIKRLAGSQPQVQISDDPFGHGAGTPAVHVPPFPVQHREAPHAVLQRDEIIDGRTRICGYRFSARLPGAPGLIDPQATCEVLRGNNVSAFAERRLALIPIQVQHWSDFDYKPLVGPRTAFLLKLPNGPQQVDRWREVATAIRAAGARVALQDADLARDRDLVAEHAAYFLLDYSAFTLPNFEQAAAALRRGLPQLELIAENVESWAERRYCAALGIAYCMGGFTTSADQEQQSGDIDQSRLVLIEMLNLLRRDADLSEIARAAKRDPAVAVKLVAMANSPLLSLSHSVAGIDQAIMLLGREQLYRWLSIGMFRAGAGLPRDEVLLELALARGRFLELIGHGRHGKAGCDELFLVGLLSLLDSLLGVPMARVVERLHLSDEIRGVLLKSEGPLGRYLMLAIAAEKGRADQVGRLAELLAIPLKDIEAASSAALAWAEEAVSQRQ